MTFTIMFISVSILVTCHCHDLVNCISLNMLLELCKLRDQIMLWMYECYASEVYNKAHWFRQFVQG